MNKLRRALHAIGPVNRCLLQLALVLLLLNVVKVGVEAQSSHGSRSSSQLTGPITISGSASITATELSAPSNPASGSSVLYPETNRGWCYLRSDGVKRCGSLMLDDNVSAITIPSGFRLYGQTNTGCGNPIYAFTGATQTGFSTAGTADVLACGGGTTLSDWSVASGQFTHNFALSAKSYLTATNCASSGGTCTSAAAGAVSIAAAATTVTVATTAVTANSQILITEDSTLGTRLSVTCNTTTGRTYTVTTRTAGTSFVITASAAPAANPACLNYSVIN